MPAATITELQETATTPATNYLTFQGPGGVGAGSWAALPALANYSPGQGATTGGAMQTSASGDQVTITWSGTALYLTHPTVRGASSFTAATDGVPSVASGWQSNSSGNLGGAPTFYRVLTPLARGMANGPHTTVLVNTSALPLTLDSCLIISGAKGTPVPGSYVAIGHSWAYGQGSASGSGSLGQVNPNGYARRVGALLEQRLSRPITLTRHGVPSDCLHGQTAIASGDGYLVGAMYRTATELAAAQPEFLTIDIGVNDLRSSGQGVVTSDFVRHLHVLLCFVEDAFDVTNAANSATPLRVAVGTPGYVTAANTLTALSASGNGFGVEGYESGVQAARGVVAQFGWARLADLYGAMDCRDGLVWPNSNGDSGLHPNDLGVGVITKEFCRALLGVVG